MKKNLLGVMLFVVLCAVPAFVMNCGEDTAPGGTATDTGGGGTDTDGGVTIKDAGGLPQSINGTVLDHQTKQPVANANVTLLDDETGAELDLKGKSADDGTITIEGIPAEVAMVGVKVTKAESMDTIQYHFPAGSQGETFRLLSQTTVSLIAGLLGVTLDPAKGVAAGSVYWGDSTDEIAIGCATVVTDPTGGETHYMDNSGIPTKSRDALGSNPANGYFSILNMTPGKITINATAGTSTEGSVLPNLPANTVAISNVRFLKDKYPTNPQDGACQ